MNLLWKNDAAQFARLSLWLADVCGARFAPKKSQICSQLKIKEEDLDELLSRAHQTVTRAATTYVAGPHVGSYAIELPTTEGPYSLRIHESGLGQCQGPPTIPDEIDSLVLAHACAGVDVTAPAYIEGLNTALEAIANHADADAEDAAQLMEFVLYDYDAREVIAGPYATYEEAVEDIDPQLNNVVVRQLI